VVGKAYAENTLADYCVDDPAALVELLEVLAGSSKTFTRPRSSSVDDMGSVLKEALLQREAVSSVNDKADEYTAAEQDGLAD
jgi:hypothetical protein